MFDRRSIRYNRSVIMKRKPGLSLNHIAETLFANETFVNKKQNESRKRPAKEKVTETKDISSS